LAIRPAGIFLGKLGLESDRLEQSLREDTSLIWPAAVVVPAAIFKTREELPVIESRDRVLEALSGASGDPPPEP
jgi:hypothetical protein